MLYLTKVTEIHMFYFASQYPPSPATLNVSGKQNDPLLPDFMFDQVTLAYPHSLRHMEFQLSLVFDHVDMTATSNT